MSELLGGITLGGKYGGYELMNQPATSMPQDLASGFYIAQEGFVGSSFEPLFVVGKQVVNGINYFVIAKQTLVLEKSIKRIVGMVINIPPASIGGKNAKIIDIVTSEVPRIPVEIEKQLKEELLKLVGANNKPIALIGTQVVKGTNYFIVGESIPVVPNAEPHAILITLNIFNEEATLKISNLIED